ncbi:hypothetical protein ACKKIY_004589, partial [Salmonella enterica subsp. enterica serovar Brandenburg]
KANKGNGYDCSPPYKDRRHSMNETELKHVITLLLEDAKRLQQVEPNAGTEARIWIAQKTLNTGSDEIRKLYGFNARIAPTHLSEALLKKCT